MKVLSIAYPFAAVGPDAVGGAEQVLSMLDIALTKAGHESLVVACNGSVTAGKLINTWPVPGRIDHQTRQTCWSECSQIIDRVLNEHSIDLLHFHGVDFYEYLPRASCRALATIHLPTEWYPRHVFSLRRTYPRMFFNFVSQVQKDGCDGAADVPVIENGIDLPEPSLLERDRTFAMSLGRICPEKNFHVAMDAAREAGIPFILAGAVFGYDVHQQYFENEIRPRLNEHSRFVGPVTQLQKRQLLTAAKCLLVPSIVAETSSLVAMEALSCGTPVVAFPAGALRTIVDHERTGFLVNNASEMTQAIDRCSSLDQSLCRRRAREKFSAERMACQYLEFYDHILRS